MERINSNRFGVPLLHVCNGRINEFLFIQIQPHLYLLILEKISETNPNSFSPRHVDILVFPSHPQRSKSQPGDDTVGNTLSTKEYQDIRRAPTISSNLLLRFNINNVSIKKKLLIGISACILTLYYILLKAGHGFELSNNNIVAILDQNLWGNSHMYREWLPSGGHLYFDPEGLLSTLPCIAHVTIGFLCGEIIQQDKSLDKRLLSLTITGITLLFSGYLLSYGCPVIKKVWSPTYVLITCGLAYLTLVLLTWIIDINKKSKWCLPFQAFGTNPLFIYIVASLLATILEVPIFGIGITEIIYTTLYNFIGIPKMASLVYALLYITINGSLAYILFKKRIFIKI